MFSLGLCYWLLSHYCNEQLQSASESFHFLKQNIVYLNLDLLFRMAGLRVLGFGLFFIEQLNFMAEYLADHPIQFSSLWLTAVFHFEL